jgi:DNA-binding CsgD family transcriptional regulator
MNEIGKQVGELPLGRPCLTRRYYAIPNPCLTWSKSMPLSERTERALEACYDAVLAPVRWPQALQLLGESLGAESCTFYALKSQQLPVKVPISSGHADFAELWLRNEDHAPDPHIERATPFFWNAHPSIVEDQISTEEERRTLPYYQETARPGKREWFASANFAVAGRKWCFPLYRGAKRGPFTPDEARYIAAIGPHVGRMVGQAEKFAAFNTASELSTLGRIKHAALVIDGEGRVKHLNLPAEELFCDDFYLVRGRPVANDRTSNNRLQQFISSILIVKHGDVPSHRPVVINRDEVPWLLVEAMPATALGSDLFSAGRAILLLTDLTTPQRPDAMLLSAVFGLTAAEARVAARVVSGKGINEAAIALGITRATACSHLKAVFSKTNTRRQAELVGLIARLRPAAEM